MTEPVAIQTPLVAGEAIEMAEGNGRYFWKDVLRRCTIDYKGRKLDFTDDYLDGLALAYNEGAFDMVPLVFAPEDNRHTQAVDAIRGDIRALERRGDRLRALVRASSDESARQLRENPNIGCSVRIEQPIQRADGKSWPAAIQHVLATANPRLNGLGPWEPVDLAADDRTVIDLSTYDFADGEDPITEPEEIEMADTPSAFTDEETAQLRQLLAAINAEDSGAEQPPAEAEHELPSDEQLAQIAAGLFDDDPAPAEQPVEAAALSNDNPEAIELARQLDGQAIELAKLRAERDAERFEKLRDRFAHELGVPPAITELARPLLTGSHTVELSNGDEVDAGEIVQKVITELAKARLVDLSSDTVYDTDAASRAQAEQQVRADEMAAYAEQFGL